MVICNLRQLIHVWSEAYHLTPFWDISLQSILHTLSHSNSFDYFILTYTKRIFHSLSQIFISFQRLITKKLQLNSWLVMISVVVISMLHKTNLHLTSFGLGRMLQVHTPHSHTPNPEHISELLFIRQAFSFRCTGVVEFLSH